MADELDDYDRALLKHVQTNARMTADALGEAVGLSPASVHRRLKRLRQSKVIQAEVAILDDKALDIGITCIVSVEVERERADLLDLFRKQMKVLPEVQQCYYVTGDADFVLIVKARDLSDYERFTREAFFDNANVRRFNTNVVMSTVKSGVTIPL